MATQAIQEGQIQRRQRTGVDIAVTVTTVLESMEAAIADLTEQGALITGCALEAGARIQIDYLGQTIYAQCRWAEVDRMGVQFVYPLADGPLFERLAVARAGRMPGGTVMPFPHVHRAPAGGRSFGRRAG
ncbi:MAG: hypothetical protein BGP16_00075 [Sphingobium sp. 66-54]|nr:MAG: hypothetical protein BGP16_00075 [Sphingobium sp. 66-54]